jgi:hypothetical protein
MYQHGCGSLDACHHRHCFGRLDAVYSSIRGLSSPDDMDEEVQRGIHVLSWYLVSALGTYSARLQANVSAVSQLCPFFA